MFKYGFINPQGISIEIYTQYVEVNKQQVRNMEIHETDYNLMNPENVEVRRFMYKDKESRK